MRWLRVLALVVGALALSIGGVMASIWPVIGKQAEGERLVRMQASEQWRGRGFGNVLPRHDAPILPTLWEFFTGGSKYRSPNTPLPVIQRGQQDFIELPGSGLRVTWFGHSTLLVELDGMRLLLDPVWGERTSPFTFAGPKRFYAPPLPLTELPKLDAVLISHDHYDHLDYPTIQYLKTLNVPFVVPLGVGTHLSYWGIESDRIIELDWWQEHRLGSMTLVSTPARHFSGRSLIMRDKDRTLWSGWAMLGSQHKVYYSGDTAMFPGFKAIGERLGPFDVTLIEAGAYNARWADVHLGPEQAVLAHRLVKGKLMIPVHWGLFDLALHGWTEPVERVIAAARQHDVRIVTPAPGGSVEPEKLAAGEILTTDVTRWWPDTPWKTAEQEPCVSSGLDESLIRGLVSVR